MSLHSLGYLFFGGPEKPVEKPDHEYRLHRRAHRLPC